MGIHIIEVHTTQTITTLQIIILEMICPGVVLYGELFYLLSQWRIRELVNNYLFKQFF